MLLKQNFQQKINVNKSQELISFIESNGETDQSSLKKWQNEQPKLKFQNIFICLEVFIHHQTKNNQHRNRFRDK